MKDRELQVNISKVTDTIKQTFPTGCTGGIFGTHSLDKNMMINNLKETVVKIKYEFYHSSVQSPEGYWGSWHTSTVEIFWNNLDVSLLLNLLWAFHTKTDFGSNSVDKRNKLMMKEKSTMLFSEKGI